MADQRHPSGRPARTSKPPANLLEDFELVPFPRPKAVRDVDGEEDVSGSELSEEHDQVVPAGKFTAESSSLILFRSSAQSAPLPGL